MSEAEKPTAPFIISLIAGIFITLGGLLSTMIGMWGYGMMGGFGGMRGMMSGMSGWMMGQQAFGLMAGFGVFGLISGIIVLISAVMLNSRPAQASTWGALIIVFSIISLFGGAMGGFLVGMILGIVGGALALSSKAKN